MTVSVAGCDSLGVREQIKSWKEAVKTPVEPVSDDEIEDLINQTGSDTTLNESSGGQKVKVKLYFARRQGHGLGVEEREIIKVTGIARATIEELLKGPRDPDLKSALPAGTRLLDINIKPDGTCIVDFNSRIREVSGSKAEALAIYSVVNTLSQFPTIKRVSFMVEGEPVESVGGYISTAEAVTADYSLSEE